MTCSEVCERAARAVSVDDDRKGKMSFLRLSLRDVDATESREHAVGHLRGSRRVSQRARTRRRQRRSRRTSSPSCTILASRKLSMSGILESV